MSSSLVISLSPASLILFFLSPRSPSFFLSLSLSLAYSPFSQFGRGRHEGVYPHRQAIGAIEAIGAIGAIRALLSIVRQPHTIAVPGGLHRRDRQKACFFFFITLLNPELSE